MDENCIYRLFLQVPSKLIREGMPCLGFDARHCLDPPCLGFDARHCLDPGLTPGGLRRLWYGRPWRVGSAWSVLVCVRVRA